MSVVNWSRFLNCPSCFTGHVSRAQFNPIQPNSIQFNPIQSNSIQFNPIQLGCYANGLGFSWEFLGDSIESRVEDFWGDFLGFFGILWDSLGFFGLLWDF